MTWRGMRQWLANGMGGVALLVVLGSGWAQGQGNDFPELFDKEYLPVAETLLEQGDYRSVLGDAKRAAERSAAPARWHAIYLEGMRGLGRLAETREELDGWVERYAEDLPFQVLARDLYRELGDEAAADAILARFNAVAGGRPFRDRDARELVAMGRAALDLGAEPKRVLEQFYGAAKAKQPDLVESYLAAGNLGLEKDDFALAAREFREGLKQRPGHPALRLGLARAFWPTDREAALGEVEKALARNRNLIDALLLRAEHLVQSERFEEAETVLDEVELRYAGHPRAWAFRAAMAALRGEPAEEVERCRAVALERRGENAEVPHVMGKIFSRRYRFAEGAAEQRQALEWEPDHLEARLQLASDLMRLGQETEAWELAEAVAAADSYNVLAYNFTVLRKELETYETIETEHFRIRMKPEEVAIYGDRVQEILAEAYAVLGAKYGVELKQRTLVEIYADQQDFAIRTFGELGGAGYLGVCFGPVITMNSPGSAASGFSNWEATLWHEFCHVITLDATRNRMPRWLSEGISVYEERERSPVWGQRITPEYRARILSEEGLTPVGELSGAFLNAKSGEDVMFAYYQSSLVVEFAMERYGAEAMRTLLSVLAEGVPINEAITAALAPLPTMEKAFVAWARTRAEGFGPEVDWEEPEPGMPVAEFLEAHPSNYAALQAAAGGALGREAWEEAAGLARRLVELLPEYGGDGNGYALLARALRGLGDVEGEAAALREWAARSGTATAAYQRLLELDAELADWESLSRNAERQMAVNPFLPRPHACRACAARSLGREEEAIESFEKYLLLGAENAAEVHFELAELRRERDPARARRHLIDALVEAPRYREAHRLLLEMTRPEGAAEAIPES